MPKKNGQTKAKQGAARPKASNSSAEKSTVVRAPTQISTLVSRSSKPVFQAGKNGDITVTHREYFTDIGSTNIFTNTPFIINPGNASMFPWLSQLATCYESYIFQRLRFQYRTAQSTGSPGRIGMVVDYDCTDLPPANKAQAYACRGAADGPVWHDLEFRAEPEDLRKQKSYYVAPFPGAIGGTMSENLSDVGILNVFTSMDSTPNLASGELWVEYTVKLMTPTLGQVVVEENILLPTVTLGNPLTSSQASFDAGISQGSDHIVEWASSTAITFLRNFTGQLILEYFGTSISALPAVAGGAGTTITVNDQEASVNNGGSAVQIYDVTAVAGQFFTVVGIAAATLTSMRIRLFGNKTGL